MRKVLLVLGLLMAAPMFLAAQATRWQTKVDEDLPYLGHRNWILIVDSAYPLQASPGVETIETNADQIEVVRYVLKYEGSIGYVSPAATLNGAKAVAVR